VPKEKSTGGAGVASGAAGTLRGLLGHAARLNIIGKNPAEGVRQLAVGRRQWRLTDAELCHFGYGARRGRDQVSARIAEVLDSVAVGKRGRKVSQQQDTRALVA
jgi:hypothetical protein